MLVRFNIDIDRLIIGQRLDISQDREHLGIFEFRTLFALLNLHRLHYLIKPHDIAELFYISRETGNIFGQLFLADTQKFGKCLFSAKLLLKYFTPLFYVDISRVILQHLFVHRSVGITHRKLLTRSCHSHQKN